MQRANTLLQRIFFIINFKMYGIYPPLFHYVKSVYYFFYGHLMPDMFSKENPKHDFMNITFKY